MSFSDLSGEELVNSLENHFKGSMPAECYNNFKRFKLCKFERNDEIIKTKGYAYFKEYSTEPFASVEGCKNEYNAYLKCYNEFYYRYLDMKNYVAEIEGKKPEYDIKAIEAQRKKDNFGLNQF